MITGRELYDTAMEAAVELPAASTYLFVEKWQAARVAGKWFMLTTELDEDIIVTVKADPEDGYALRQQYPSISPGYHMNKKHWITVRPGEDIDAQLVRELVRDSYLNVLHTLPKSKRPIDPEVFLASNKEEGEERKEDG